MTRLTFSCSRSTPRSLHIFRKWEKEDWSRRIYALTCRWLHASKRSLKISVSVKESMTRAIICNKCQKKSLGCFHSIPREMVQEEFHFQIKYSPPPFFFLVVTEHGTVFHDMVYSSVVHRTAETFNSHIRKRVEKGKNNSDKKKVLWRDWYFGKGDYRVQHWETSPLCYDHFYRSLCSYIGKIRWIYGQKLLLKIICPNFVVTWLILSR